MSPFRRRAWPGRVGCRSKCLGAVSPFNVSPRVEWARDPARASLLRLALAVVQNESAHPAPLGRFIVNAAVPRAPVVAHALQRPGTLQCGGRRGGERLHPLDFAFAYATVECGASGAGRGWMELPDVVRYIACRIFPVGPHRARRLRLCSPRRTDVSFVEPSVSVSQGGNQKRKERALASREELQTWVIDALRFHGGVGTVVQVAKHIWQNHETELRNSGDLFYTWQYDMRWACTRLRERKIVQPAEISEKGQWKLNPS